MWPHCLFLIALHMQFYWKYVRQKDAVKSVWKALEEINITCLLGFRVKLCFLCLLALTMGHQVTMWFGLPVMKWVLSDILKHKT